MGRCRFAKTAGYQRRIQGEVRVDVLGCRDTQTAGLGISVAIESASLVYNRKLVTGKVPTQLSELPAFGRELKAQNPKAIVIMWDYNTPYFSWPFLASAGAYPFKKTAEGYDVKDIGVDNAGAVEGLKAIVELIKTDILPKGSTQSVMSEKMAAGQLALMVNGPWDWANLRKAGVDFDIAPIPGVGGNPGRPWGRRIYRTDQSFKPERRSCAAISGKICPHFGRSEGDGRGRTPWRSGT
jgi:hypothetical protein